MKNRRTVVVAFMLAAIMLLGVGYAALNSELELTADIGADKGKAEETFDGNIYFSAKAIQTDDTGKATCVIDNGADTVTITADQFTTKGQKVIALITIKNESTEFDANVTVALDELESQHNGVFSAKSEWYEGGAATGAFGAKTIAGNGGEAQILVTITLNETPTEAHNATYNVKLNVESVDMSNG